MNNRIIILDFFLENKKRRFSVVIPEVKKLIFKRKVFKKKYKKKEKK